jgi:DNA-directed RNA polymerase specialized sigma24 family protein
MKRRKAVAVEEPALDRVERLLALLLLQQMKGASQGEKALHLNRAGFSNTEIADLLGTGATVVASMLYKARQRRGRA